ncbi:MULTISPECIES: hypothetical protein [unclassified Chelatococcus]|uniref:hypothetical protein n=1 Tax=unclassified Chelatococcus TaxID=2638111 RepID=UPI001BCF96E3|nr:MULTISPECIES: hypothetical protein [unclassified Chelatococcus]MBS7696274.1 hypothetical protein [Chelatococcus sp. YT9]MBX3560051.1 hypothetical protein [Chelatococcus sp.]
MIYLVEIDAHNGAALLTFRFATEAYITSPSDSPANTIYEPRIVDPGSFSANLYNAGQTGGSASIGFGDLILANADGGLDAWFDYGFDGRRIEIKQLAGVASPFSSAVTVFKGTIETIDTTDAWQTLRVRIFDNRLTLDRPLQVNRYAGTTLGAGNTAEGTEDLRDQPKPLAFGAVYGIRPFAANPWDGVFQVADNAVYGIQVYDGGSQLTGVGNYGSLAALIAATVLPGRYATCLNLGLFRITRSAFQLTADVQEGALWYERNVAFLVRRMLQRAGLTTADYSDVSLNALNNLNSAECGIWIDSDQHILDAVQQVLNSVGAWIAPNANGVLEVGRFEMPGAPVTTLTMDDIIRPDNMSFEVTNDPGRGVPVWRVVVRYKRNYTPLSGSEVSRCTEQNEDYKAYLATEWRERKAEDAAIKTKYKNAGEMTIETCLTQPSDALAEATRLLSLYKVRRDRVKVVLWAERAASIKLNDTVTVQVPRFGYAAGRPMRVIGRDENRTENIVTLDLFG